MMTVFFKKIRVAACAALVHLGCSLLVAFFVAVLVFGIWYPYPYLELSGGRELFFLVIIVDVICGPILTFVLFNPSKPRGELCRDLLLVGLIQLGALGYGVYTIWIARPLFLVMEVDRFKVISAPDLQDKKSQLELTGLPSALQPSAWAGPKLAGIVTSSDPDEKRDILFESINGGRDYAVRPKFYVYYDDKTALKSLDRAKPISYFLAARPEQRIAAQKLFKEKGIDISKAKYLPVIGRQDWIAVLNDRGQIQGFLKGDGF